MILNNCRIISGHLDNIADLIKLEMVNYDVIMGLDYFVHIIQWLIFDLELWVFSFQTNRSYYRKEVKSEKDFFIFLY